MNSLEKSVKTESDVLKLDTSKVINGSQVVPGYPAHGVVIQGTTAEFQQTSNYNANAAFQFTELSSTSGPGNIQLQWKNLGNPGYNSNLGLYNFTTQQFDYYIAYGVTYLQTKDLNDYISSEGVLEIVVWLNLATGTLESLTLNY